MAEVSNGKASAGKTAKIGSLAMFIQPASLHGDEWKARVGLESFVGSWEQCWDWINKRLAERRKDARTKSELQGS